MPNDDRKRRLDKTVADLQTRFGLRAIGRAVPSRPAVLPTGFPALDHALGIGGLPLGRVTELAGVPTSGMATLALHVLAAAQSSAYIDLDRTFDPDYAARCAVDLDRLLLIRPHTARQAAAMLPDLALGGFSILVCDASARALAAPDAAETLARALGQLVAPLSRSTTILLFLSALAPTEPPSATSALAHYAAVRLHIQREHWLYHRRDLTGYAAQVRVIKNRLGPTGRRADITITLNL